MTVKAKTVLSLICNAVIFLGTTGVVISDFFVESELIDNGWESFVFFTTDSNVLAAIAAVPVSICEIRILQGRRNEVARAFTLIKYAGVVSLMLTFFTVLLLLVPLYGVALEWGGTGFHMHVAAPVLSFVSFVFFDRHGTIRLRDAAFGMLPVVIYGAVYLLQVVVFQNWMDFYAFNTGGMWFVTMPVIFTISFLMCLLVKVLRNKAAKQK